MSLGMIARADGGGLGALTWELWAHLKPERTLVVLADHTGRGPCQPERYDGVGDLRVTSGYPTQADVIWLTYGIDILFSSECWYAPRGPGGRVLRRARQCGIRTVLQPMPEMYLGHQADLMIAPTPWRMDVLPSYARFLQWPAATERFTQWEPRPVRTLYHITSGALLDRNGTQILLGACEWMHEPCDLLIRGAAEPGPDKIGPVRISWLSQQTGPYWEAWPAEADAFVMPRRYGGLCLPIFEAAALGLPIIATDLEPQRSWLPAAGLVQAHRHQTVRMLGGRFSVNACKANELARVLDRLVAEPAFAASLAQDARRWAESIDWSVLQPEYERILR